MAIKSHRKCQKCRYDLCVKAGMTQTAILTEEQIKFRFRKTLEKKQRRNLPDLNSTPTGNVSECSSETPDAIMLMNLPIVDVMETQVHF